MTEFLRSLPDRPSMVDLNGKANSLLEDFQNRESSAMAIVSHFGLQANSADFTIRNAEQALAQAFGFSNWGQLTERVAIEAIKVGDSERLQEVLSTSEDVPALLSKKIADEQPTNHAIGNDCTLLQFASVRPWKGADLSPQLISGGAEIDLHSACGLGNVERISEILKGDSTALTKQVDTYFPLQYAITASRPDSIRCLMEHGDDPNRDLKKMAYFGWEDDTVLSSYLPWKPIHMASLWGFDASRIPVARNLIEAGADLNAISPLDGYRPIHLVAMPNRVDMIKFFIESGVDVDSRTQECEVIRLAPEEQGPGGQAFGNTPLMIACGEGFSAATECLLDLGADVNARNERGQTALHLAARRFWNGQPYDEVIKLLLERGADKEAKDDHGESPKV